MVGFSWLVGDDTIKFLHEESERVICKSTSSVSCHYVVVVYSPATSLHRVDYSLLVSINKEHVLLKENMPVKSTLLVGEYDYYKYQIMPDPDIVNVYVSITPLSGDPELFTSRTLQTPGWEGFEKIACFCVNILHYSRAEIDNMPEYQTIYISTYGLSTTTYTINIIIQRNIEKQQAILLYDGVHQKGVFVNGIRNIVFAINIPEHTAGVIVVHLQEIKGSCRMVIRKSNTTQQLVTSRDTVVLEAEDLLNAEGKQVYAGFEVLVEMIGNELNT